MSSREGCAPTLALLVCSTTAPPAALIFARLQDASTELGYPEFIQFVGVIKQLELRCRGDEAEFRRLFGGKARMYGIGDQGAGGAEVERRAAFRVEAWNKVVARIEEDAMESAWDKVGGSPHHHHHHHHHHLPVFRRAETAPTHMSDVGIIPLTRDPTPGTH